LNVMLTNGNRIENVKQIKRMDAKLYMTFEDPGRASIQLQENTIYMIY
jgi:hypothetical protein